MKTLSFVACRTGIEKAAKEIVEFVIADDEHVENVYEASVHLPRRSRIWQATFTGPEGGQFWKSTGMTNRDQALLVAKRWEAEARAEQARRGSVITRPIVRVRRNEPSGGVPPLTQREVALVLKISERAVRLIERCAVAKIKRSPALRKVWQKYLAGELEEGHTDGLTQEEAAALLNLARTPEEQLVIFKILRLTRG